MPPELLVSMTLCGTCWSSLLFGESVAPVYASHKSTKTMQDSPHNVHYQAYIVIPVVPYFVFKQESLETLLQEGLSRNEQPSALVLDSPSPTNSEENVYSSSDNTSPRPDKIMKKRRVFKKKYEQIANLEELEQFVANKWKGRKYKKPEPAKEQRSD